MVSGQCCTGCKIPAFLRTLSRGTGAAAKPYVVSLRSWGLVPIGDRNPESLIPYCRSPSFQQRDALGGNDLFPTYRSDLLGGLGLYADSIGLESED